VISVSAYHDDMRSFSQIEITVPVDARGLLLIVHTGSEPTRKDQSEAPD
jgi:hypothetical protein